MFLMSEVPLYNAGCGSGDPFITSAPPPPPRAAVPPPTLLLGSWGSGGGGWGRHVYGCLSYKNPELKNPRRISGLRCLN